MKERSIVGTLFDTSNILFMLLILLVMAMPFLYVFSYSLSSPNLLKGGLVLFPAGFTLDSFARAFGDSAVLRGAAISVARSVIGPAVMLFFTSMAAYVLTRTELLGLSFFRKYFVFTLYFSSGIIPMYLLMGYLQLKGTFLVYIIPGAISVFNMVLIKTYIESLPKELSEAAVVDGANRWKMTIHITLPSLIPTISILFILAVGGLMDGGFDQVFNLYNPTVYDVGDIIQTYVYRIGLAGGKISEGAALGVFLSVINVILLFSVHRISKRLSGHGLF